MHPVVEKPIDRGQQSHLGDQGPILHRKIHAGPDSRSLSSGRASVRIWWYPFKSPSSQLELGGSSILGLGLPVAQQSGSRGLCRAVMRMA